MAITRVSQSKLKCWRHCRKQYDYRHIQKLEPKRIQRPLVFGRTVHKIIEYNLIGMTTDQAIKEVNKDRKNLFTADQEDWDGIIRDAEDLMVGYHNYWSNEQLTFLEVNGKKAEHKFEYDLAKGIVLSGIIDAIPKTDDGRVWIEEHKSHREIPTEDVRVRDLQSMIYADVVKNVFGIKRVAGVMWDYIRSKTPSVPKLLKTVH